MLFDDASVSFEWIEEEPRAMEEASEGGLGRLQSVENASDLAQSDHQHRVSRGRVKGYR